MRIILNKWQRGLLLLASAGILFATLNQNLEHGIDGSGWIVPVVIAVAIAFVGVSDLQGSAKKTERPADKLALQPDDPQQLIAAMARCSAEFRPLIPAKDAARATLYGYVLTHITAMRVDPEFEGSPNCRALIDAADEMYGKVWRSCQGKGVTEAATFEARMYFFHARVLVLHNVMKRMAESHAAPFRPLYEYVSGGNSGASDEKLETKYGAVTRKLLLELLGR